MKKYIKWIIAFITLFIFCFISVNIYKKNILISDDIVYNFISEYFFSDKITPIVRMITGFGDIIFIVVITVISLLIFKDKKIRYSIIVNLILVSIINSVLKLIFMRSRPNFNPIVYEDTYSFPSGHSMISMAFYGYLIYLIYNHIGNKMVRWGLIIIMSILVLLIGISRIYLGAHYASDVIGGFCFSITYLVVFINVTKKIIK